MQKCQIKQLCSLLFLRRRRRRRHRAHFARERAYETNLEQ